MIDGGALGRGNPDHPVTAGFTCAKIKRLPRRLRHPQQLVAPMIRSANQGPDEKLLMIGTIHT